MYILDTSALRGIGRAKLIERHTRIEIAISPLSFYELLTHLEEGQFERQKGNLLKCKIPTILTDPLAMHALSSGVEHLVNASRFEDSAVIPRILENLEKSPSLHEFYQSQVLMPDGTSRKVENIGARAATVLAKEEQEYAEMIECTKKELQTIFPNFPTTPVTDAELALRIGKTAYSLFKGYESDSSKIPANMMNKVICSTYLYYGYINARALLYLEENAPKFDPNDCEDAYISLHLDILRNDTLVTGDGGTLTALKKTLDSFKSGAAAGVEAKTRVIDVETFLEETNA